jgi:hypothetical protein
LAIRIGNIKVKKGGDKKIFAEVEIEHHSGKVKKNRIVPPDQLALLL